MRLRPLIILGFLLLALWPAATVQADEVWKDDIERDTTWTAQRIPIHRNQRHNDRKRFRTYC